MVVGDSRGRIAWTLLGRVPATRGPGRLFGPLEYLDAVDHPRISDPPVGRLWTANQRVVDGPLEAVLGDDEVDVGAGGYDIGARARQIRDDCWASRIRRPRRTCWPSSSIRARYSSRAGAICCWRSSTRKPCRMRTSPRVSRAGQRRRVAGRAGRRGISPGAHVSQQHAECHVAQPHHRVVRRRGRRSGAGAVRGGRLAADQRAPHGIAPPGGGEWRDFLLLRVDSTIAELLEGVPTACRPASSGSSIRSRSAIHCRARCRCSRRLLDMPTQRARRRSPHAARAGRQLRCFGALRGVARARGRRLPPAAGRAIRASVVAVLSQRFRGLGDRQTDAIPAGPGSA